MRRVLVAAASLSIAFAWAVARPASAQHHGSDVCQNQGLPKASAVINVGTGTAKIIDAAANKSIFVCGLSGTLSGTAPTVAFIYGTHTAADCDTGTVALSGAFAPSSGSQITPGFGAAVMTAPAGMQLCATTTGIGASFQGAITYLQR
jgi:hypothetical protein